MMANGLKINLKDKEHFIMKILRCFMENSILTILIKFLSNFFLYFKNIRYWTKYVGGFHDDNKEG